MQTIALFLADGFEEIEALSVVDILRRADIDIKTVSISDERIVKGSHDISIVADCLIAEVIDEKFAGVILPGGLPGSVNLKNSKDVIKIVQNCNAENKLVAAICAAPIALAEANILADRNYTCYPSIEKQIIPQGNYQNNAVVIDDNIITGRGPGATFKFALAIVSYFKGEQTAQNIASAMYIE